MKTSIQKTNILRTLVMSLIVLTVASACTWWFEGPTRPEEPPTLPPAAQAPEVGSDLQVTGTIIDTIDDCAFDGICAYVVDSKDFGAVNVIWSEGMTMNGCSGQFEGQPQVGDNIEALGLVTEMLDGTSITICASQAYYVRPASD